ncbi:MAG: DUF4911 domain-containing protein [Thermodesulfobacteriota bacterium]
MESSTLYLRISPGRIHFLKFILEAYDNLAIISVHDGKAGIVLLRYSPSEAAEIFKLLTDLAAKGKI